MRSPQKPCVEPKEIVLGLGTHGANFTPEVAYRKRNPLLEEYITTNRTRAERVHNKNKEKLVYVYSTLI